LGMSDEQKEADGTAVRFSNRPCTEMLVTVVRVLVLPIEKVVRLVRHKLLLTEVGQTGTFLHWRDPSRGVHPLDKGDRRQCGATSRSGLDCGLGNQEPGNSILRDEIGVGGGDRSAPPDDARVRRVLPRDANLAVLSRVGAKEVGDDLLFKAVEQC